MEKRSEEVYFGGSSLNLLNGTLENFENLIKFQNSSFMSFLSILIFHLTFHRLNLTSRKMIFCLLHDHKFLKFWAQKRL